MDVESGEIFTGRRCTVKNRVYIDCTATANTLHHTGIQRVTRTLIVFGAVRNEDWVPIVWDSGCYRLPNRFERSRLTSVFSPGIHRWRKLTNFLGGIFPRKEENLLESGSDTVFLLTEIPSGERLQFLDELASTGSRQMVMVGICHDLLSWSHPEWTASSRKEGFEDYLRLLGLMERIICPSQATAIEWDRFQRVAGIVGPKAEVMPWPVSGELKTTSASKDFVPMILSVGTFEARKNHDRLLDAAEMLWKSGHLFELQLVGRQRARGENEIPDRIAELRRQGRQVEWTPRATDEKLEALYQRSAFTVFPSLAEGYGLPVAEALIRGKPCICSGEGAMGEIAAGGGCLVVRVEDSQDIAKGVEELLTNPKMLKNLSREADSREWPSWSDWMDALIDSSKC